MLRLQYIVVCAALMTQSIGFPRVVNAQMSSAPFSPQILPCSSGVACGFGEEGESEGSQERPRNSNIRTINSSPQPNRSRFTNLGTSAERLVGHWFNGMRNHLYFSGVNSDGIGSSILTMLGTRRVYQKNRQYKLINYQGALVTIQTISSSDSSTYELQYQISENGQVLSMISENSQVLPTDFYPTYRYVDNKTKP